MELLLIRHGRPHPASDPGGANPGLTGEGRRQARAIAAALVAGRYGPITAAVSSTMRRAVETAEPSAGQLGLELTRDERLVELDQGAAHYYGGIDHFAARADAWASLNDGRWGDHTFDPAAFTVRVLQGVEAAIQQANAGNVAIFCHGGMISAYLGMVIGSATPFFFAPDYGSVSRVLAGPGDYREFLSANETGHLTDLLPLDHAAQAPGEAG
jgi:broad specificity phosphatase PhoE